MTHSACRCASLTTSTISARSPACGTVFTPGFDPSMNVMPPKLSEPEPPPRPATASAPRSPAI